MVLVTEDVVKYAVIEAKGDISLEAPGKIKKPQYKEW